MKRTSLLVAIAFLVGLAIGFYARGAGLGSLLRKDPQAAALAAIKKLHQADIDATLKQDPMLMTNLWSADGVKVDGPNGPIVGLKGMKEMYDTVRAAYPEFKVLKYTNDATEVQIADGWAIELSYSEATYQISAKENPVSVPRTQGMRLLKKQTDGSWKFALVGMKQ